jgi:Arc/MetJ-type ribon-helix-helix transcriptional regulator
LLEAVEGIDPGELSDVIREALRKALKPTQKGTSTPARAQKWMFPRKP